MSNNSIKSSLSKLQSGTLPPINSTNSTPSSNMGLKIINEGLKISHYEQTPSSGTKLRLDSIIKK